MSLNHLKIEFFYIEKINNVSFQYIKIVVDSLNKNSFCDIICLPNFKTGTQYKFLKLDIQYELKDLGL